MCVNRMLLHAVKSCLDPGGVTNADRDLEGLNYGNRVTYTCRTGYKKTNGDSVLYCDADQTWSGVRPTCDSKIYLYTSS